MTDTPTGSDALQKTIEAMSKFNVRDTDIFLLGYVRSGTTWAREMIWLIANDLNYEGAKVYLDERFPVLDSCVLVAKHLTKLECHKNPIQFAENIKGLRCLKMHWKTKYLPEQLVNGDSKCKIVYIARNPKDVVVSTYIYTNDMIKAVDYTFDEFCLLFMDNLYEPFGNYWDHIFSFWKRRNESNVLFIKYEEMKQDLLDVIRRVSKFLNKTLTEQQEEELMNWLSFENIKSNKFVNQNNLYGKSGFIRNGTVGDHKTKMSSEMISKYDDWIKTNIESTDYII
ncbi:hypothetical protein FQA39_LY06198 [Lamprigera yunnana]|nr:hypothetical protein FQA39_LY06198 [Lamprigera yunnana]